MVKSLTKQLRRNYMNSFFFSNSSSSTGSETSSDNNYGLTALIVLGGFSIGTFLIACCARLICRRVDASRNQRVQHQIDHEVASVYGNPNQTPEQKAMVENPGQAFLARRQRSCWERLCWAQTTGNGCVADTRESLKEGCVAAVRCCAGSA
jgi:hypothetical protein